MAWKTSSQAWRIGIYRPFLINYVFRKRTLNHYRAITTRAWREIMHAYEDTPYEKWVYSCRKMMLPDGRKQPENGRRFTEQTFARSKSTAWGANPTAPDFSIAVSATSASAVSPRVWTTAPSVKTTFAISCPALSSWPRKPARHWKLSEMLNN